MDLDLAGTTQAATRRKGTGTQTTHTWARQSYLEPGAMASAVPCARGHVRLMLRERGLQSLADPAEQVVSELMTNAVAATYGLWEAGSVDGGRQMYRRSGCGWRPTDSKCWCRSGTVATGCPSPKTWTRSVSTAADYGWSKHSVRTGEHSGPHTRAGK